MERDVTLLEMLEAREDRARRLEALRTRHGSAAVSFTLNIAGPVKDSPLIRRAFQAGLEQLEAGLRAAGLAVLDRLERRAPTGCEAQYAVDGPVRELQRACVSIEDGSPLGRLFELDVLTPEGRRLDREAAGGAPRRCLVCGAPGTGCASRRIHTAEELQAATRRLLEGHFASADRERAAALVTRALLDEVGTTPKPGLVDRANTGSHRDMDIFTFHASAAALFPYWANCVQLGQETADQPPASTFSALRRAGQGAERTMFAATGGVNTHKGAVFTLGVLCGAIGRLWSAEAPCRDPERILTECASIAAAVTEDLASLDPASARTAGQRLYLEHGLTGVRGEAAQGFPSVARTALPVLRAGLAAGLSRNDAGTAALLRLIAQGTDTNLISRGGPERAAAAAERCQRLLQRSPFPAAEEIARLDREFIQENLSPGGCADLLAAAFFLQSWELAS
ncbi:triphosphoribosyl-dephospho-CoA synthase CitG [Lawsonibacter sp. JLR.KK007]|uniref:triphosphoribosyl-dephospho-CoA synthase CitG n=1 Tax=Lawsonibacter sp. JLR.KK007 TaxID=3114293 RepID=UPI002FEE747B